MQRIRTIIPKEGEGVFYHIDDLLPLIPMKRDEWDELVNEIKNHALVYLKEWQWGGLLKIFDKFQFVEEIHGATGTQKHFYYHREFFRFFCDKKTIERIKYILDGVEYGKEAKKPL